jgi:hypothetical protein
MCQSAIGCDVDSHVYVTVCQIANDINHFGQIAYPRSQFGTIANHMD